MSISTNSVLRSILDDVRHRGARGVLVPLDSADTGDAVFAVARSDLVRQPPFATSLHFWAHALQAFLAARGRPDTFDALAVNCLCEAVDGRLVRPALEALVGRAGAVHTIDDYEIGYRMIDQPVLVSWVAERRDEYLAVFWTRPDWLGSARELELD